MSTLYLRPNAAGDEENIPFSTSGAGNHWQDVDEATADEDGTRVYNDNWDEDKRDLYNLDDISQTGTINWIKVWTRCKKYTAGKAYTAIKTEGTAYNGSLITLTTSYADYSTQYTTNPKVGGAWTWAQLNALQAGVRIVTAHTEGECVNCTQVYVEVDYTAEKIPYKSYYPHILAH